MDEPIIRRRDRLTKHYTIVSNLLIFGYADLTDAEKLTYIAIQSFDWTDPKGERKGFAFPSVRTLAKMRATNRRTIFRHLEKLEERGLLRRESRPGHPTLMHLDGPSEAEKTAYLSTIEKVVSDTDATPRRDTDATPHKQRERETDKTVNAREDVFVEEASGWKRYRPTIKLSRDQRLKRDYIAGEILKVTKDPHSLGFYRKVADGLPEQRIFAALSQVREASRTRPPRNRGALFSVLVTGSQNSREEVANHRATE